MVKVLLITSYRLSTSLVFMIARLYQSFTLVWLEFLLGTLPCLQSFARNSIYFVRCFVYLLFSISIQQLCCGAESVHVVTNQTAVLF